MKKQHFRSRIIMLLICFVTVSVTAALAGFQENAGTARKNDSKKTEERRADDPQQSPITLRITVSVDGLSSLPEESSIQLRGLDDCDNLVRHGSLDPNGQTTFSGVPVCKVIVKILITGLDAKIVSSVDLAPYRSAPMRIQVKSSGPPLVN
jgi:hypothetical protein